MNFRLVYVDKEGRCKIVSPDAKFQQVNESTDSAFARIYELAIPDVIEFIACKAEHIPKDPTFRDAWEKGDIHEPIKINLEKAVAIHRKYLQEACERKIVQLDHELTIALENDNLPEQVALRRTKKILRNLHETNLTHCKTPLDLVKSVPKELVDVWPCPTYFNAV